jgi:mRNA N6-methyladenine demethylase
MENMDGKWVNILDGMKLHTDVFYLLEQAKIIDFVYAMQNLGKEGRPRCSVTF